MGRSLACSSIFVAALSAGCAPDYSPNTYASTAVQQANKTEQGLVVGVRLVDVTASGAIGAATGAAAGGIAGSQTPGGFGSAFGALGGALVGGLVGSAVEHAAGDTQAVEYIVRKSGGELVSVTQKDAMPLAIGTKVLVIAGSQARIVADYTAPPESLPDVTGKHQTATVQPTTSGLAPFPPAVSATPLAAPAHGPSDGPVTVSSAGVTSGVGEPVAVVPPPPPVAPSVLPEVVQPLAPR